MTYRFIHSISNTLHSSIISLIFNVHLHMYVTLLLLSPEIFRSQWFPAIKELNKSRGMRCITECSLRYLWHAHITPCFPCLITITPCNMKTHISSSVWRFSLRNNLININHVLINICNVLWINFHELQSKELRLVIWKSSSWLVTR